MLAYCKNVVKHTDSEFAQKTYMLCCVINTPEHNTGAIAIE